MYHIQQSQSKTDSTASPITLSVPLQSVIDYLGFRAYVVATQETTIEIERTIDIKSRDFPALRDQLALLYSALHLSTDTLAINANENVDALPSFVSFDAGLAKKTSIATTASSKNSNSFYLMNTCGIFPADLLKVDMQLQAFFAFKLRPEYVKMYGQVLPLFSNAYRLQYDKSTPSESVFGIEHSKEEHPHFLMDQALATASQHLQQEVIPSFVQSLENNELVIVESRALTHSLHEEGINMRYLGACFEYSTLKHIRKLFLSEMLARACKVIFREFLRNVVYESNTTITRQAASATNVGSSSNSTQTSGRSTESSILQAKDLHSTEEDGSINPATIRALSRMSIQHDVRQTTIEFFNLVLGVLGSNDSKIFWKDRILPLVKSKFGILLSLETILNEEIVHLPQLFLALQMHTNVMFTDTMKYNFKSGGGGAGAGAENSSNGPLSSEHFVILLPITNLLARTTLECENLLEHTDELIHANQLEQALTNIKLHLTIQESAPFDNRNVSMCHLMTCTADLYLKLNAQEKAEKFASLAIEDGPVSNAIVAKAHIVYMKLNHLAGDLHDVQAHFNKAIEVSKWHLGMSHPYLYDTYMTMMEIWHECGELKAALKSLESCACVARECFGRTSLIYADIRHRQGNLLYESKQFEEAISMLEDAVSVYEKHFKDHRLTSSKEKNHTEIKNNNNVDGVSNISQEKCDQEVNVLSPSLTQKELAAACYYLMAVIKMEEPTSSAIEAAYNLALRALSLRQNVLPPNHIAIMESFLQLGTLSKRLGDYYRAIEVSHSFLLLPLYSFD
jgi:tetratricopeptide (TPR) repeat protein